MDRKTFKSFKSLDTVRTEDAEQMKRIEQAIVDAVLPFAANTDPLLGVIALTRCVRTMLRAADTDAQKQLLPVLVAFLRGQMQAPGAPSLLWMPTDHFKVN